MTTMRRGPDVAARRASLLLALTVGAWLLLTAFLVVHPDAYSHQCGPGQVGRCAWFNDKRRWVYPVGIGLLTGLVVAVLPWSPHRLRLVRQLAVITAAVLGAVVVHWAMYAGHHIRAIGGG
jgi:hypothetical protein